MVFEKIEDLRDYLALTYPKSKGKALGMWKISSLSILVGVYEDEDLIQGLIVFKDPLKDYRWVLLDSLHADLATRNYIEFIEEFDEAIALYEFMEEDYPDEENLFETLD